MGKAGKRKEMVEEWCGTGVGVKVLCVAWESVCPRIVCEGVVRERSVCKGVV